MKQIVTALRRYSALWPHNFALLPDDELRRRIEAMRRLWNAEVVPIVRKHWPTGGMSLAEHKALMSQYLPEDGGAA